MPSPLTSLCQPAAYGCNTAADPILLDERNSGKFIRLAGNMRIHNNRWRTAYPWRELQGFGADLELWQAGHTQNAMWYMPRSGQGVHYLGVGDPRIVDSTAGRLFTLTPRAGFFEVKDVSGGNVAYPHLMLAWLAKGENYLIRTDGRSQTQIWDGVNPVFFSTGYNQNNEAESRFPNAAGPTVYAGGRFWTVLFGRRIYVSDSLHQVNQTNATDLLKFTDQTYDFINIYFAPPGDDGDIFALTVTVNSGNRDSRAQGEVLACCPEGPTLWGVQLGIPRTEWPTAAMRQPRSKEAAPTGPNAFYVRDGDILMRTAKGIESMNLLARERNTLGNPAIDLGADMKAILSKDDQELLLFASVANPQSWDRLFCTVTPQISGARHWHLGYVTANFNPLGARIPQGFAWEGLNTLPPSMGRIVQFLPQTIEGRNRMFAILDKHGESKGLAELCRQDGDNILADGTHVPIEWFLETRKLTTAGDIRACDINHAWLRIDEAKSSLRIQVFVRTSTKPEYQLCRSVSMKTIASAKDAFGGCGAVAEKTISLGNLIEGRSKGHTWAQFLIKGRGVCTIDMIVRRGDTPEAPSEAADMECVQAESGPPCTFDPYFYALA